MGDCKDCKLRDGDCGNHFEMNGIKHFDIPRESSCDKYGFCMFFEPEMKKMDEKKCVDYLENIRKMFVEGSKRCDGKALKDHQDYILAIGYAIAYIQGGGKK